MGHTSLCVLGLLLLNKLLNCGRAEGLDAVLTVKPNWPTLFHRESVTFTCDLTEGKDTDWKYTFTGNGSRLSLCGTEKSCSYKLMKNSSGDYQCTGRHKSRNLTAESKIVSLNVAVNSRPVLTVSPSWLSAGASVTLKCSAEDPSAGWRFYWFKAIPKLPNISYSYELLPGSSSGTEQDSYIVHGQKHTAGYVCRAGRGDPVFYTYYSKPKFVWSGDIHLASLRVSPDRVQHFPSESVSLSCEGNSTEWRMMRFTKAERLSNCSDFGTVNGSTCNVHNFTNNTAVYWCESGSGQFSNAVNITVQNTNIILLSPVHPVTEGHPVTLGCKWRKENLVSNVLFYRNGHLIQNDTRGQLNISEVSKSDEGFHWCEHSGNVSPQSWVAVKLSRPETSSVILPVIIGLVCGMSILLLLWCCCRKSKYLLFARTMLSQKANQNSANQDGSQSKVHPSHQSGADETSDGIYSLIQIKYFGSGERVSPGPTVETVYSEVKLGP